MTKEELKTDESKYIIELIIKDKLKQEAEKQLNKLDLIDFDFDDWSITDAFEEGYIAGAEPREKRIAELDQKLEQIKNENFEKALSQIKHDREVVIEYNERLQKENTELKEKLKPENCIEYLAKGGYVKFLCENGNEHDQLTKAKELLERFLGLGNLWNLDCKDYLPLRKEVEQFLSEVEK